MGQSLPKAVTSIVLEEDVLASGIESTPKGLPGRWDPNGARWFKIWLNVESRWIQYRTTDKGSSVAFSWILIWVWEWVDRKAGPLFRLGSAEMNGHRPSMEDTAPYTDLITDANQASFYSTSETSWQNSSLKCPSKCNMMLR